VFGGTGFGRGSSFGPVFMRAIKAWGRSRGKDKGGLPLQAGWRLNCRLFMAAPVLPDGHHISRPYLWPCSTERGDANFANEHERCVLGGNERNERLHLFGLPGPTRRMELKAVTVHRSLLTVSAILSSAGPKLEHGGGGTGRAATSRAAFSGATGRANAFALQNSRSGARWTRASCRRATTATLCPAGAISRRG
jgi:hypothetical protein